MTTQTQHRRTARRATADRSGIERADAQVAAAVAPIRETPLIRVTSAVSEIADQPPLVALSALVAVTGLAMRDPRLARAGARMLLSHALATWAKGVIKDNVDRSRPRKLVDEGHYRMAPGDSDAADLRSFPSGHTAGGTAVVRALARVYPQTAVPGGLAMGLVAAALIPKQAHYPSDIAAGAAIGWAAEAAVDFAWRSVELHLPNPRATR